MYCAVCFPALIGVGAVGAVYYNHATAKTTLGMETLTCKTPIMIEKEMWIGL